MNSANEPKNDLGKNECEKGKLNLRLDYMDKDRMISPINTEDQLRH